ncbi:hypothetical protein [uncultured Methanobacterium sp.]|uniref:hypothetical protein n=1 Tax=uncultured Methanobacterium sp. TaxID=176306 RepID=UPI003747F740
MKNYIKSLIELDYTKYPYIIIFIIIFLISRIPFLNLGFGNDPDAWRIANSAFDLNHYLIYHTSRFPGYPLPEYVNSLVINYGWLATNSLTMILTLISVLVFAKILKELEVENKGLIVITFAFLPIVWINSVNTMDYMWAVTFIIISWYFVIKKQHLIAGLMMGLAIASRPTSFLLLIPFIYLILSENEIKEGLYFLFASLIVGIAMFSPLLFQFGLGFISFYPTVIDLNTVLNGFISFFGLFAVLILILLLIKSPKKAYYGIKTDNNMKFASFVIFLIIVLFIGCPYDTAYLLPAIPFALYFLSKIGSKRLFNILCIFLILNSFISVSLTFETSEIVGKGIVFSDAEDRILLTTTMEKIIPLELNNSIIITGEYYPILLYLTKTSQKNPQIYMESESKQINAPYGDHEKNIHYVYITSAEDLIKWQNKGYKVYYMNQTALGFTELNYKYDLREYNTSDIFQLIN